MKYSKYHALGNDYIVIDPNDGDGGLDREKIRLICHRNYGVGSDGILLGPIVSKSCDFKLRIFNPDGSSSTAAAAVALKLGLCDSKIRVHMPGGNLDIQFKENFFATMTGPVVRICEGNMDQEMFVITF